MREVEEEGGGGMMKYIKYGRVNMIIKELVKKNQGRIKLGRDVMARMSKYRIDKGNGYGKRSNNNVMDSLSINNPAL